MPSALAIMEGDLGVQIPAGFLPIQCGRFPQDSVVDAYQNHPVFLALRDPDQLHCISEVLSERDVDR